MSFWDTFNASGDPLDKVDATYLVRGEEEWVSWYEAFKACPELSELVTQIDDKATARCAITKHGVSHFVHVDHIGMIVLTAPAPSAERMREATEAWKSIDWLMPRDIKLFATDYRARFLDPPVETQGE